MELRQLEYFVAVAEEASFTRAAARVHVAQPGVSAQIRRLERELGQELLDRSGRSVRVTEAGAVVGYAAPPGAGIHVDVINEDVLAAAGEPLGTRATITLAKLAEHDLICLPAGSGIRASLDEGCARERLRPRVSLEASRPEVVA